MPPVNTAVIYGSDTWNRVMSQVKTCGKDASSNTSKVFWFEVATIVSSGETLFSGKPLVSSGLQVAAW